MTNPPAATAPQPVRRTTVVAAAIIADERGQVLLNQRPPGQAHAGLWEFPGGKVEPGEDPRHALVRECREEMGCTVEVGAVYETIFHTYGDKDVLLLFYTARITAGQPVAQEGNTLAWVAPAAMDDRHPLLEADRPLVAAFLRHFPRYSPGVLQA